MGWLYFLFCFLRVKRETRQAGIIFASAVSDHLHLDDSRYLHYSVFDIKTQLMQTMKGSRSMFGAAVGGCRLKTKNEISILSISYIQFNILYKYGVTFSEIVSKCQTLSYFWFARQK